MDRQDHEVITHEQDFQERRIAERDDFALSYQRASVGVAGKRMRCHDETYPDGNQWTEITQQEAKKYIPDDCYVWKTNTKQGWGGHCPPYKNISESTVRQIPREAMFALVRRLWMQHNKKHRIFPLEQSPAPNLFPAKATAKYYTKTGGVPASSSGAKKR